MSANIKALIRDMNSLPTMPNIVVEALNLIKDPNVNINVLATTITKDLSITGQILKLVNSAFYGFPKQITTINKALALLGLNQVNSLIMSVAVKPMLVTNSGKLLWKHSLRCAIASQMIAKNLGIREIEEYFIMGLLHDIGKTLFHLCNPAAAEELDRLVAIGADRMKAEQMLFGFTHQELGAELLNKWNLPNILLNGVLYHHDPRKSEISNTAGVIYLADRLTQENLKFPIFDHDILQCLDFEVTDAMHIREEAIAKSDILLQVLQ